MKACKHLVLLCLALLLAGSKPYIERTTRITWTTDHQERLISPSPLPRNFTSNDKIMMVTEERRARYRQSFMSSSLRNPEDFSWKHAEALTTLLVGIIRAELSQCTLGIVWDSGFDGSTIIDSLSFLPNAKQVVGDGDVGKLLWQANQCRGYILLLTDPSSLMYVAEYAPHTAWDYSGRIVIAGLSTPHIETLTRTRKGRKTEHILGIVENNAGDLVVLTNLLYKKDRLARIFTWTTPVSTNPGYSTALSIKSKGHSEIKSLVMKQPKSTPNFTQQLFPDKTKNLQGSTLNVVTFVFPPEIMYRRDANGTVVMMYGGNVRLVETVSEMLNFTIRYMEPPQDELWGHQLPNGTWHGMVGLFARGEGDIGIANLFISAMGGREEHQGYTAPYGQESTCILIKRGTRLPRWQSVALPFKKETWFAVLLMAFLMGPLLFVLSRPLVTREMFSRLSLSFITLYTFGVHLKISQRQLPVRVSLQIFVGFLWVYVIIVIEAYSAKLVAFLTVERIPEGINTLEELYHSSLPIYGQTPFWTNSLSAASNVYARKLAPQYSTLTEFESIYKHLVSGQGVYIASTNNLVYTISLFSQNGNPTLRVMKECYQPFNTAMGLQRHSPLKSNLDRAVTWIVQAGLIDYWLRETLLLVRQERWAESHHSADGSPVDESGRDISFSMEHLQGVFIMFGIGCGLSLLVFAAEFL